METIGLINETKFKEVQPSQLKTASEFYPQFSNHLDDNNFEFQNKVKRPVFYEFSQKKSFLHQNPNNSNCITKNLNVMQPVISHFFIDHKKPKIEKLKEMTASETKYHWQSKKSAQLQESTKNSFDNIVNSELEGNVFIEDKETLSISQRSPETYYEQSNFADLNNSFESMVPLFHDSYQVDTNNKVRTSQHYKQEISKSQNLYSQPTLAGLHSKEKKSIEAKSKLNQTNAHRENIDTSFEYHNNSWSIDGLRNCNQSNFDCSSIRDSIINHHDISDDPSWSSNFLPHSTINHEPNFFLNNDEAFLQPSGLCRNKCTTCTRPEPYRTETYCCQQKSVSRNNLINESFVDLIENPSAAQIYEQKSFHPCHLYICNSFVNEFCKKHYCEMCHSHGKLRTKENIPFVLNQNRVETNDCIIQKRMPCQNTQVSDYFKNTHFCTNTSSATKQFVMEKFINSLDDVEPYEKH